MLPRGKSKMRNFKATKVYVTNIAIVLILMLSVFIVLPGPFTGSVLGGEQGVPDPTAIPKYNGTIVVAIADEPPHLNPGITPNVAGTMITDEIYSSLVYVGRDWKPYPEMAESYEVSDDGLKWVFKLRENMNWTDGVPVTSADVLFTWNDVLSVYNPLGKFTWSFITKIEAIGPHIVVFTLNNPVPYFLVLMNTWWAPILPKHIFEGTDLATNPYTTGEKMPVGCGPYIMTEWAKGDHLTLVKNPNYWWTDPIRGYPLPYLDKVIYKIVPSLPAAYQALKTGELDYLTTDSVSVADLPEIKQQGIFYYLPKIGPIGVIYMYLNLRHSPLDNKLVRQALTYATDKQYIVDNAMFGQATLLEGPFGPANFGYTNDTKQYPYNITKANELLDQAGYPKDPATGIRFRLDRGFPYNPQESNFADTFEILKQNWKLVGVELAGKPGDSATVLAARSDPDGWDVCIQDISTAPDPSPKMESVYCTWGIGLAPGGQSNEGAYSNATNDALWLEARTEMNETRRAELFAQIQRILTEDAAYIWLWQPEEQTVWSKEFVNACQTFSTGATLQMQLIWWVNGTAPATLGETVPKAQYDALKAQRDQLQADYDALQSAQTIPVWVWGILVVLIAVIVIEGYLIIRPKKQK
jgi:peptide/nickel transport system substrate-binding protein